MKLGLLVEGWYRTLGLVGLSGTAALLIGVVTAVLRLAPVPLLPRLVTAEVEVFRNTPLLVQMSFAYFALPRAGFSMTSFRAGALALSLYTGAFISEAVRSGILSVGAGQMEAARSLGMRFTQSMRHVVLPQAVRTVVPPIGTVLIAMVKNSAIASAIGYAELIHQAERLNNETFRTFYVFNAAAIGFLLITLPLSAAVFFAERRLAIKR